MPTLQHSDPTGLEILAVVPHDGPRGLGPDTELIVEAGQRAVLFLEGRALDGFPTGRHVLGSAELPLLKELKGPAASDDEPLEAQVAFLSSETVKMKWGTREPVVRSDAELGVLELRAFGTLAVGVSAPGAFVDTLVGKLGLRATDAVEVHLREILVARLGEVLRDDSEPLLELLARPAELVRRVGMAVTGDFAPLGVELRELVIGEITPPRHVARLVAERIESGTGAIIHAHWSPPDGEPVAGLEIGAARAPAGRGPGRAAPAPVACPECGRAPVPGACFCAFCGFQLGS